MCFQPAPGSQGALWPPALANQPLQRGKQVTMEGGGWPLAASSLPHLLPEESWREERAREGFLG